MITIFAIEFITSGLLLLEGVSLGMRDKAFHAKNKDYLEVAARYLIGPEGKTYLGSQWKFKTYDDYIKDAAKRDAITDSPSP